MMGKRKNANREKTLPPKVFPAPTDFCLIDLNTVIKVYCDPEGLPGEKRSTPYQAGTFTAGTSRPWQRMLYSMRHE
ncbi:MAG: hypothetical protein PHQ27_04240, partial [Victivallales bacterium]|nr:hypothetical protein [Victivallales bacterium]